MGIHLAAGSGVPMGVPAEEWNERHFHAIQYTGAPRDGILEISPTLEDNGDGRGGNKKNYLASLAAGGPLEPFGFSAEYDIAFPSLDIRMVNNGKETLHIAKVRLAVDESRIDVEPLPQIFSGYDQVQRIDLLNEGWGRIEKAEIEFDLVSKEPPPKPTGELPFKRTLHRLDAEAELPLHAELEKHGLPPALTALAKEFRGVERRILALHESAGDSWGPDADAQMAKLDDESMRIHGEMSTLAKTLTTGRFRARKDEFGDLVVPCWLTGWMTYTWKDGAEEKNHRVALRAPVLILPPEGLGAPGPVIGRYEAMLRENGADYTVEVPVSHIVKPGDTARFTVTLGVTKSSLHRFRVALLDTRGTAVDAGSVNLRTLLPRSAVRQLQYAAEAAEE